MRAQLAPLPMKIASRDEMPTLMMSPKTAPAMAIERTESLVIVSETPADSSCWSMMESSRRKVASALTRLSAIVVQISYTATSTGPGRGPRTAGPPYAGPPVGWFGSVGYCGYWVMSPPERVAVGCDGSGSVAFCGGGGPSVLLIFGALQRALPARHPGPPYPVRGVPQGRSRSKDEQGH